MAGPAIQPAGHLAPTAAPGGSVCFSIVYQRRPPETAPPTPPAAADVCHFGKVYQCPPPQPSSPTAMVPSPAGVLPSTAPAATAPPGAGEPARGVVHAAVPTLHSVVLGSSVQPAACLCYGAAPSWSCAPAGSHRWLVTPGSSSRLLLSGSPCRALHPRTSSSIG
jgi:hypothetical protein